MCSKLVYGGLRSCWSRLRYHTLKIENDGSNMVVENFKKAQVSFKIEVQVYLRSLITILPSDFPKSKWRSKVREKLRFRLKFVYRSFRGRWSRFRNWTLEIQNGGTNMAVKSSKKAYIWLKIGIKEFLRSLIRIFLLDFRNSKWRIQYDNKD